MRNIKANELDILATLFKQQGMRDMADQYKKEFEDLQMEMNRD